MDQGKQQINYSRKDIFKDYTEKVHKGLRTRCEEIREHVKKNRLKVKLNNITRQCNDVQTIKEGTFAKVLDIKV
jgi:hypothetical protein